jgi:transposase
MIEAYLGIDIAKRSFDVKLLTGRRQPHRSFPNTAAGFEQLAAWLHKQGVTQVHACMEATNTYWEQLAHHLHAAGHVVSVLNPTQLKDFAKSQLTRTQTDRVDAGLAAAYCQKLQPRAWTPPLPEVRQLQDLVRRLAALEAMRQQEANRLGTAQAAEVVRSLEAHLAYLDGAIATALREIDDHIDRHPGLRQRRDLLLSIPGIGDKTANSLLGELLQLDQRLTARQVAAQAGLVPARKESGTSVRKKSKLAKTGNRRLRAMLYWPAITAWQRNPAIAPFCRRLQQRGKHNMAIIAAAMRKLLHQAVGVLKSGRPFDAALAGATP